MADLGTVGTASPLDADDNSYAQFTADTTETLSYAMDNTPADFGTMDSPLSYNCIGYRLDTTRDNDTYELQIRIVNGATILAAADSGGTFQQAVASVTSQIESSTGATAFIYTNTTADKTAWDGASVEIRQVYSKTKGADGTRIFVDQVNMTGTYTTGSQQFNQTVTGSSTWTGALTKETRMTTEGSSSWAGALLKQVQITIEGASTWAGALATSLVKLITLTGSATAAGALLKEAQKQLTGSSTWTGAISWVTTFSKLVTGSSAWTGTVAGIKTAYQTITGSLTAAGALIKQAQTTLAGSLTGAGVVSDLLLKLKTIAGSMTPSGSILKEAQKQLAGAATATGDLIKQAQTTLAGTVTATGNAFKQIGQSVAGTISATGDLVATFVALITLTGSSTMTGTFVNKQINKVLAGAATMTGVVATQVNKLLTGVISMTGALSRQVSFLLTLAGNNIAMSGVMLTVLTAYQSLNGSITGTGGGSGVKLGPPVVSEALNAVRGWIRSSFFNRR